MLVAPMEDSKSRIEKHACIMKKYEYLEETNYTY